MVNVSKKILVENVDDEFWKALTKDSVFSDVIEFKDIDKAGLLEMISMKLFDHSYTFTNPIEVFSPKSMGILRKKELFTLDDTTIYYFCLKFIQDPIIEAIKENRNVFGAFRMTKELSYVSLKSSVAVDSPEKKDDEIAGYESVLAREAYKKDWNEFQSVAEELFEKNFDYYINLDVAHFYNDINLDILERRLRGITQGHSEIVDLLFYLLRNYRKGEYGFYSSHRALPQNDIGEMSRLLANLYLSTFDGGVRKLLDRNFKDRYEYVRYSDDMWIAIKGDKSEAEKAIQIVSFELLKIELFINEGKIQILERNEFGEYWCFDLWEKIFTLRSKKDAQHSEWMDLLNITIKMSEKKNSNKVRWFSPQLYILKVISGFENPEMYFNTSAKAAKILNLILGAEKNLDRSNSGITNFVYLIIRKYPNLRSKIDDMIGNSIYPSMEYFALKISIGIDSHDKSMETFDRYSKIYFSSFTNKWQWFSRCLILKAIADHSSLLSGIDENVTARGIDGMSILKKIITQFENNRHNTNYIERRYQIFFLKRFSALIGDKRIENNIEGYYEKSLWTYLNPPKKIE